MYIHEDSPGRQMFIYTPHKYTRVSQNYKQVTNIYRRIHTLQSYSSMRSTLSFSNLSSHFTSICITTSTLAFLVISSCETSQKLYPFL